MNPSLAGIEVVAFDIDGTLYPNYRLYPRLIFHVLRHLRFYFLYSQVRKTLHKTAPLPDFYAYQARLLAEKLHCTEKVARQKIDDIVYKGLEPYLFRTRPFENVGDAFQKLRDAGLRIALLSDFPPSQKGDVWGLLKFCELALGSEEIGALKPSKYPFGVMAMRLGVSPEKILYVGNSVKYDVQGAKGAGMKSALIISPIKRTLRTIFHRPLGADIFFSNYRQFIDIVLQ